MLKKLLLEAQIADDPVVLLLVRLLEVLEVRAAVGDHLQEAATRVLVLHVLPQMGGQFSDLLGQKAYLYGRRPSILVVLLYTLHYPRLLRFGEHVSHYTTAGPFLQLF